MSTINFERKAIEQANKCKSNDHPKVGCVIVKNGEIIAEAYRNELGDNEHAEATAFRKALEKYSLSHLQGATLFTTLEPCAVRRHTIKGLPRMSCAELIIYFKIKEVVYGEEDLNPDNSGKGLTLLKEAGVVCRSFSPELMQEIRYLNFPYKKKLQLERLNELSGMIELIKEAKRGMKSVDDERNLLATLIDRVKTLATLF
jgi:diaminohydroxyphosphoribosylaminopyrimidine deaminase/5-amino-6-(5-phosphoribosylamino)uracil reductase